MRQAEGGELRAIDRHRDLFFRHAVETHELGARDVAKPVGEVLAQARQDAELRRSRILPLDREDERVGHRAAFVVEEGGAGLAGQLGTCLDELVANLCEGGPGVVDVVVDLDAEDRDAGA